MLDRWIAERLGVSRLTPEGLKRWQLQKLNALLTYARTHSPFYAARLPSGGLSRLEDLAALPFTTAADLQREGTRLLCVGPDAVERIVTQFTSGSTGPSKRVFSTREDQERTVDFFHRGMATLTTPGARVLQLFPGDSPGSLNDLLRQGLARMGAASTLFGYPTPQHYAALCGAILEQSINFLIGPAAAVAGAAEWSAEHGCAASIAGALTGVLLAADYVSPQARGSIARHWGCPIHEQYAMTETGFIGPVTCSAFAGYHLPAADLYCEIVHPDTLLPVPEGEEGEVVLTTLSRRGMPLIRYRTGDRSAFLPGPCPCGSVLPRLRRVSSRPQPKKFNRPDAITF